jgi:agmatine deiminase
MLMRPADLGFLMPAEGSAHAGCWMAWPKRAAVWGDYFAAALDDYARVANAIARFEPVTLVVDPAQETDARTRCGPKIKIAVLPIDDSWLRDSGPTYVVHADGRRAACCFTFNAWGEKYHPYDQDARVGARIAEYTGDAVFKSGLVVEGGGFYSDGEGTLITAETCVLNPNRNPGVTKAAAEAELRAMLGVSKVIWVPGDVTETETDGHVDGYLAYIKPGSLLFEEVRDPADPRYRLMKENRRVLETETDAKGRTFELVPIAEAPPSAIPADAKTYCRSYVNFYLANGAVIVPAYGINEDAEVFDTLKRVYADRQVVPVQVGALFRGGGGIHCITQQEPVRPRAAPQTV